jgi:hypothetical protein
MFTSDRVQCFASEYHAEIIKRQHVALASLREEYLPETKSPADGLQVIWNGRWSGLYDTATHAGLPSLVMVYHEALTALIEHPCGLLLSLMICWSACDIIWLAVRVSAEPLEENPKHIVERRY